MKNSIEAIWKEGFLNERSLVAPKINDLYNQKSSHLVDRMKRMFRINLAVIVVIAVIFPVVYYFLDFMWQGAVASAMLLLTAWYNKRQMNGIKTLDQGSTSLDYLKSFDRWLEDVLLRTGKVARFSYPLYFMIALSIIWSAWNKQEKPIPNNPNPTFIENTPLLMLVIGVAATILMFFVSNKIYQWEVRLMYGRIIDKLKKRLPKWKS